ncbi:MAG: hypothetical protein A2Y33_15945 [Spirochaetes bacterium GWF1_51_8]|nr:MAG: hypothetical protein A2Y33_15945 [Spirochaetes bacterium GWF1_51_8]
MGKKFLVLCIPLVLTVQGLFAQETFGGHFSGGDKAKPQPMKPVEQPGTGWSYFECILAPSIAAGFSLTPLFFGSAFNLSYWEDIAMMGASLVPIYFVNPLDGLFMTMGMGGLVGIERALDSMPDALLLGQFAYNWIMEAAFYSSYVAYFNARAHAAQGIYNDKWREELGDAADFMMLGENNPLDTTWKAYGFGELFTAPLDGRHYNDMMMLLLPVAGVIGPLVMYSHKDAMWTTGKSYLGQWEVPAYVSIPVMLAFFYLESTIISISEEALFRGFLFEDVGATSGLANAAILDCTLFPAVHVPQEIEMGLSGGTIALNFLRRSVLTFYLDLLYLRGGLTHSVTAHMLIDFSQLFTLWLMNAGAPQDEIQDILPGPVEFAFRIPF